MYVPLLAQQRQAITSISKQRSSEPLLRSSFIPLSTVKMIDPPTTAKRCTVETDSKSSVDGALRNVRRMQESVRQSRQSVAVWRQEAQQAVSDGRELRDSIREMISEHRSNHSKAQDFKSSTSSASFEDFAGDEFRRTGDATILEANDSFEDFAGDEFRRTGDATILEANDTGMVG
jgi:hypothetical protein